MKKFFISIEGCDGAGKSTIAKSIHEYLISKKINTIKTREPGGNDVAEKLRNIIFNNDITAMSEALIFAAARIEHIQHVIKPALENNKIVICDRYFDSSVVYQGYVRGLGIDKIKTMNDYAIKNFKPDLTIILDIDINTAQKRIKNSLKKTNRIDNEKHEFHQNCREGFNKLKQWFPKRNIKYIDASKSEEEVRKNAIKLINEALQID